MSGYWLYRWQGICSKGKPHEGELLGTDKSSAGRYLISRDLQPLSIRPCAYLPQRYWRNARFTDMATQLASLLEAGMTLVEGLRLLADDNPCAGWRCLLRMLAERIEQGHPLSLACADFPRVFSPLHRALFALGELTGRLEHCCRLLAEHEGRRAALARKIRAALRYPLFISLSAMAVLVAMLIWVLPEFSRLYASLNAPLPAPTRGLLTLAADVTEHGLAILAAALLPGAITVRLWHHHPRWRRRVEAAILRCPWLGDMLRHHALHHLFHTLAVTHQAGITLDNGLEMAARALTPSCYAEAALQLHRHIRQGFALHLAFRRHPLFPAHCHQLIRTGEFTGTLDDVFERLAALHRQQACQSADGITRLAEPALMLLLGGLVCALVVILYLPLLQLGDAFGHF
ncbi:protein transport protein HofC [Martelella alba]|uniref:Protein transport protein HofC n=1 Tax=Martelella alba TaxID=2590451 RepID=A0ABY2SSB1_9HYPH|nr:protein transport protein HofC [Martelella alba]TKI08769.1 protein transport protein HofC [Martelella alba]